MPRELRQISDLELVSQVLRSHGPVLVEYWREDCMPCTRMAPVVEALAEDFPEVPVLGYRLDPRSRTQRLWKRQHLEVTPTLVLYEGGVEIWRRVGVTDRATLQRELSQILRPLDHGLAG